MTTNEETPMAVDEEKENKSADISNVEQNAALSQPTKIASDTVDDVKSLPVRQYLDSTVVPLLLMGMQELVKERPSDPVQWLAHFLLKNNSKAIESETNEK